MDPVCSFHICYRQILQPNGELRENLPDVLSQDEDLLYLYQNMVLARCFDKKSISLQRTGQIGTYPSVLGQEAIGAAIGFTMQTDDVFVPYYRDHTVQMIRGVKLSEILQYWGGDERGNCYANSSKDFPVAVPIASQSLHAAGVAFALQYHQTPQAVLTTIGEGGTSQGDFYEAMNVAGSWSLPVVFVVNNNQWAISVPLKAQTACQTIAQKAIAAGFEGIQVDGNDVISLTEEIDKALQRARNGQGPTLIEAITYRLGDHTTADDASRYRSQDELEQAWALEPIKRMKKYLVNEKRIWDEQQEDAWQAAIKKQIDQAVHQYLQLEPQKKTDMVDHLFETLPETMLAQRRMLTEVKL